jgi:hypothetical protein
MSCAKFACHIATVLSAMIPFLDFQVNKQTHLWIVSQCVGQLTRRITSPMYQIVSLQKWNEHSWGVAIREKIEMFVSNYVSEMCCTFASHCTRYVESDHQYELVLFSRHQLYECSQTQDFVPIKQNWIGICYLFQMKCLFLIMCLRCAVPLLVIVLGMSRAITSTSSCCLAATNYMNVPRLKILFQSNQPFLQCSCCRGQTRLAQ